MYTSALFTADTLFTTGARAVEWHLICILGQIFPLRLSPARLQHKATHTDCGFQAGKRVHVSPSVLREYSHSFSDCTST